MGINSFKVIHQLDPARPGAQGLLIRHAKRDPILPGDSVWNAGLTAEGQQEAVAFGRALEPFPFGGAFASPIPRCVDTASLILEGWGHAGAEVVADWLLLNAYVTDKAAVKALFEVRDSNQLILEHVAGVPLPGFHSIADGSMHLVAEMKQRMRAGALTLFVSHDALLMPFRAHFFNEQFSTENWFPCLHGAAILDCEAGTFIDGHPIT